MYDFIWLGCAASKSYKKGIFILFVKGFEFLISTPLHLKCYLDYTQLYIYNNNNTYESQTCKISWFCCESRFWLESLGLTIRHKTLTLNWHLRQFSYSKLAKGYSSIFKNNPNWCQTISDTNPEDPNQCLICFN